MTNFYAHPTATIDSPCEIGNGTRIWHYSHIMRDAVIGDLCTLGQNVHIASGVIIGNHVKIQNNVSVFEGVTLQDFVFCGPSCVFTNVINPRAEIKKDLHHYQLTLVARGASIGANATIVCGSRIGRYAFIGAGSVVTRDPIPDYALMVGNPSRQIGWMSRHGERLYPDDKGNAVCKTSKWRYALTGSKMSCLDWPEDKPL